ncbi:MAG: hypothetical protein ACRDZO_27780 [Egibacteraceae bacterium]
MSSLPSTVEHQPYRVESARRSPILAEAGVNIWPLNHETGASSPIARLPSKPSHAGTSTPHYRRTISRLAGPVAAERDPDLFVVDWQLLPDASPISDQRSSTFSTAANRSVSLVERE